MRVSILSAAVCLVLVGTATGGEANAAIVRQYTHIPPQGLGPALQTLAKQRNLQVVYLSDVVDPLRSDGAMGELTTEEAFKQLLGGTGLTFRYLDDDTVTVGARSPPNADDPHLNFNPGKRTEAAQPIGDGKVNEDHTHLVAQADIRSQGMTSEGAPNLKTQNQASVPQAGNIESLEEVLVTGTHLRGVQRLPMPSINFDREDIEKTGYARVEELFRSLPQNLASIGVTVGEGASDVAMSNTERATGIDLRGLGPQSTLVLLNGKRRSPAVQGRVVDVSSIPLSVIERVEVVTGGRTAIYGSDAVAGVVNLVTRRDFDGSETSAYYGGASAGAERLQVSQIFGGQYERSGFVAAYDFSDNDSLDATDAGIVRAPSSLGITPTPGDYDLQPESTRHSGYISGRYAINDRAELFADALYTSDEFQSVTSYDFFGIYSIRNKGKSDQYSFAPGIDLKLHDSWRLDVSGVYSELRSEQSFADTFGSGNSELEGNLSTISAIVDGSLISTTNVDVKAAFGVEQRWDEIQSARLILDEDRVIKSAFAEALVSFLPTETGRHQLQLSLAGRYSEYSDFGNSFDPQLGLSWTSDAGLTVRGAYSTAFRAPDLFTLNEDFGVTVFLFEQPDPAQGNALVPTFGVLGSNASLQPEEATTWSAGIDYSLPFTDNSKISLSYFDIDYEGRIDEPLDTVAMFTALGNEASYPELVDRTPDFDELEQVLDTAVGLGQFGDLLTNGAFDPSTETLLAEFPNLVFFNNRFNNVAAETMRGLDLTLDGNLTSNAGMFSFGFNGTYYFEYERKLTGQAAVLSRLNAPSQTVDFRLRANAGWTRAQFGAFVYVNYVDQYTDTLAIPAGEIGSWTTVDLTLRFDGSAVADAGFLSGLTATLGIQNLLDKKPPLFLNSIFGIAYDPSNSNALGRFVSLGLVKKW